jgi:hypothetical protein
MPTAGAEADGTFNGVDFAAFQTKIARLTTGKGAA